MPARRTSFDPLVVGVAGGICTAFVATGVLFTETVGALGRVAWAFIAEWFGWVYILATAFFVFFTLFLGFSRFGRIKLGRDDDTPEFSTVSWIAMMFAVGIGIGLIFYGAAEPVLLWDNPPPDTAQPRTQAAAQTGMQYALFHWALHPWAFYGLVGLALAYMSHRRDQPPLISTVYVPLLGERVQRAPGRGINVFVVFATLVGNAVTLGLGALQVSSGLTYLGGIGGLEQSLLLQAAVVAVLTGMFVLSAVAGVARGIQVLANTNLVLASILLLYLLIVGPLRFMLELLPMALGGYLFNLIPMSLQTAAFGGEAWMRSWTVFLWAWGISWAPYVGTFLSRISRGRTIREYVLGVLITPSLVTVVWFTVLGGTSLHLQTTGQRDIAAAAAEAPEAAMFEALQAFPLWPVMTGLVIALAAIFFVSGADAGAIVLGTFSSWGSMHPRKWLVATWGTLIGLVAIVLLLVGGLEALQWAAIVAAAPFVLVLIGMSVGLFRALGTDPAIRGDPVRADRTQPAPGFAPRREAEKWVRR